MCVHESVSRSLAEYDTLSTVNDIIIIYYLSSE